MRMKEAEKLNIEGEVSTNKGKAKQEEIVLWIHFPHSTSDLFVMVLHINSVS